MIFYNFGVVLWYQFTKTRVDLRSGDTFVTSVACLDILAFFKFLEDFELYFAVLRRFYCQTTERDAKRLKGVLQ